jgi:hypothetical protein
LKERRREKMFEKIKKYCEHEIMCVEQFGYNPHEAVTRCYGAVMFLLSSFEVEDLKNLGEWWDNEMLPKFRKLQMRRSK